MDDLAGDYSDFIELAKSGELKPSAGGGIGVERLVRYLTGSNHIADIQLFKRIPGKRLTIDLWVRILLLR